MGGTQDPMAPREPTPQPPAAPAAPAGPNALDTLVASMSRVELLVLAAGALMVLIDVLSWFVEGFGVSNVIFIAAALGVALVLLRKSLPTGVAPIYWALLFLIAATIAIMGARGLILDVLFVLRPPIGASPAFLLDFVALLAATAAAAWAAYMMWRGRTA